MTALDSRAAPRSLASREPTSRVGSHVAVAGGLAKVGLREAAEVGAEVIQVFTGNPRGWAPSLVDPLLDEAFREKRAELGLPVYVHAPYLINLGSPDAQTRERSAVALGQTLARASAVGADAVVVHAGSSVTKELRDSALGGLHDLIATLLDAASPGVRLLVEPTAGGGEALASTVDSTIEYLDAVRDERVGICIDTCHLHASGEDLVNPAGLRRAFERLTDAIGRERLGLVHVNDSRDLAGSRRDRHESLGLGTIGVRGLGALFSTPVLRGIPFVVETPTHLADVTLLKELRAAAAG